MTLMNAAGLAPGRQPLASSAESEPWREPVSEIEIAGAYAVKVGGRLRAIRRQKHLSLQDVEAASNLEFNASVLRAYERGERAIPVPPLPRLARFYLAPVAQPHPAEARPPFGPRPGHTHTQTDPTAP